MHYIIWRERERERKSLAGEQSYDVDEKYAHLRAVVFVPFWRHRINARTNENEPEAYKPVRALFLALSLRLPFFLSYLFCYVLFVFVAQQNLISRLEYLCCFFLSSNAYGIRSPHDSRTNHAQRWWCQTSFSHLNMTNTSNTNRLKIEITFDTFWTIFCVIIRNVFRMCAPLGSVGLLSARFLRAIRNFFFFSTRWNVWYVICIVERHWKKCDSPR